MEKRLLSVAEAAFYLGISPKTLYNRLTPGCQNPLPFRPRYFGRRVLFDRRDLDKFIDGMAEVKPDTIERESGCENKDEGLRRVANAN